MSEIVFILGAGASRDCGAPLMNDFLDTASRLLSTNEVGNKKEHFERVFRAISSLQSVHSKAQIDLNNIESIFTALEIANVLQKLPGFEPEEIPLTIASLKELIVVTLENTIKFPTDGSYILASKSYDSFTKLIEYIKKDANPIKDCSIITFNYDIALDVAMYRNGFGPVYGFGPVEKAQYPTKLLKLHGSLNWAVRSDTNAVETLTMREYFSSYRFQGYDGNSYCRLPIGSQLKEYYKKTNIKVNDEPVIVPPAWNKADYHHSLSTIWSTSAKELEEAEYIFIIGYSLPETDAFFRLLYGLGTVGVKPLKKIIVYNPDETGIIENRFRDMMGPGALARFEYRPLTFADSISDIKSFFPGRRH
ncbi:hypothetical protein [Methylovorus sp. MP688]|uniref:hypothetical protein n=1 Tax=Methylovorus sp. (strain MP688) TaxID=887061 RepID=UPI0011D09C55|nr:hypothetical protein [Methylovorus sp. MP688]